MSNKKKDPLTIIAAIGAGIKVIKGAKGLFNKKNRKTTGRAAAGIGLITIATVDMQANGITWQNIVLASIGGLITIFSR